MSLPRFAARVDSSPVLRVELHWPDSDLSPNRARNVHWARKAKLIREYRAWAHGLTIASLPAGQYEISLPDGDIPLTVTFHPPDNRKRDRTNMEGAFKAGFDGIADALGVDDNRFVPTYRKGEVVKGGKVIVEIGV